MIVTCERCATQFQLDDSRIPVSGVRVRCSRCKHAFEIRLPEPGGPAEPSVEEEESDWEFNADLPTRDGDATIDGIGHAAATHVVDDLLGAAAPLPEASPEPALDEPGFDHTAQSFDLREDPEPPSESIPLADEEEIGLAADDVPNVPAETPQAPPPAEAPGPSEGSALDPKPGSAPDPGASGPIDHGLGGTRNLDLGLGDSDDDRLDAGELELDGPGPDLAAPPSPTPPPAEAAVDELGTPDNWDLYGERETDAIGLGAASPSGVSFDDMIADELIDDQPHWHAWISQSGGAIGMILVVGLFGFGLFGGLRAPGVVAVPPSVEAPGIEVADISGRWIDHLEAGSIYVVTGRLHNARAGALAVPRLALELTGESGQVLSAPVPLRAPHRPEALRESPLEALAAGADLRAARPRMRAGEKRSFEVVIAGLPRGTHGFRFIEMEGIVEPEIALPVPALDPAADPDSTPGPEPAGPEPAPPDAASIATNEAVTPETDAQTDAAPLPPAAAAPAAVAP